MTRMGIRVNRALGWALTNVHLDDERTIDDPRINTQSILLARWPAPDLLDKFRHSLHTKYRDADVERSIALDKIAGLDQKAPHDAVIVHDEAEEEETNGNVVLLIRPVHQTGWHRWDDDLDYVDASMRANGTTPILQELDFCPFSYDGQRMDAVTSEPLSARDVDNFRFLRDLPEAAGARSRFAESLFGTADWDEVTRRVVPNVPNDVRDLLDWSGLLTSPQAVGQLRPVLYTFWR